MKKEMLIIDRVEGEVIVCEDFFSGIQKEILKTDIISSFKEGDILIKKESFYIVDTEKTAERKEKVSLKFNSIW